MKRYFLLLLIFLLLFVGNEGNDEKMIVKGDFRYSSSIDPINNLYAKYAYNNSFNNMPIVVVMHGYNMNAYQMQDTLMERIANEGFFVVAIGMRGRDGASGSKDSGAREIYDIYDGIVYVRENFESFVSQDKVAIVGYSGGGGNALSFATKFPDTANVIVSHFGMSDYGYDHVYGWYHTNPSYQNDIEGQIGGSPDEYPDKYYARASILGLKNYSGGFLYLFHDEDDSQVDIIQSQRVEQVFNDLEYTNFEAHYSNSNDSIRWLHSQDTSIHSEPYFLPKILTEPSWIVPTNGEMKVLGYLKTKRFEIWLGDGTNEVADLSYDLVTKGFTVKPLTGKMTVKITYEGKTKIQTIIDTHTFNFNEGYVDLQFNGEVKIVSNSKLIPVYKILIVNK